MTLARNTRTRKALFILLFALVLLGVLRAMLPIWVTDYVNRQLDTMGEYHGEIEDVDLHLIVGSYSIKDLIITKQDSSIPVPFVFAPEIELALAWAALLRGKIVAKADFYQPQLIFVDGEDGEVQGGLGVNWRKQLEKLAPFRLDEIRVHNGMVHFYNFTSEPPVDLQANDVNGYVLNMSNVADDSKRAASYSITANLFDASEIESQGQFDSLNPLEDFNSQMKVSNVELTNLNEFFQAYLNFDVASGDGSFVMELDSSQGQLVGYAKPLFKDVDIFKWEQDVEAQRDNPLRLLWESIAGGLQSLLKNQSEDQFATRIEIRGEIGNPETSTWQAIKGILANAFIEAYRPVYESLPNRREKSNKQQSND